jgi:hypothetical protein
MFLFFFNMQLAKGLITLDKLNIDELYIHPTSYSVLMCNPTAICVNDRPYFKYFQFFLSSGVTDINHSWVACAEEDSNKQFRCNYCCRLENALFEHQSKWVPISQYPYSRLPLLLKPTTIATKDKTQTPTQRLLDSIVLCFSRMGVADINIEKKEFHDMATAFFSASNPSEDSIIQFNKMLKTLTREKVSLTKKKLANIRRSQLCSSLQGKFCNLIIDSGTYAGKTRLLVKVGRPVEMKNFETKNAEDKLIVNNSSEVGDSIPAVSQPHHQQIMERCFLFK